MEMRDFCPKASPTREFEAASCCIQLERVEAEDSLPISH